MNLKVRLETMTEYKPVRVFHFEVNAIFAKEELANVGIESTIRETNPTGEQYYELMIDPKLKEKVSTVLDKLNLDEIPIHQDSEGYLEEFNEWSIHMYNPIYYFERKKLPHLFYNRNTKRLIGI